MTTSRTRFASAGVALLLLALPIVASAQDTSTTDIQTQIRSLLAQIEQIKTQIAALSRLTPPVAPIPPSTPAAPTPANPASDAQCKSWFDGCNTCSRSTPGAMGMCTQLACTTTATPSCLSRFSSTPTPATVENTNATAVANCPVLTRGLARGDQGDDVAALQTFLITRGYLTIGAATGFFGVLTEAALQDWQAANRIVSSGDAQHTGWGLVGPATRAAIAAICSNAATPATPAVPPTQTGGNAGPSAVTPAAPAIPPSYTGGNPGAGITAPVAPVPPTYIGGSQTPNPASDAQCKSWFDGCNTCSRSTPGAMGMCTQLACTTTATPSCLSRFSSIPTPVPPQTNTDESIPSAVLGNGGM